MGASAAPGRSRRHCKCAGYTPLTADQLYQLVSPVALFPTSCWRRCWPARVILTKSAPQMHGWCKTAACSRRRSARQPTLSLGSVRGPVQFPDVLDQMAKNIPPDHRPGSAYLNDPTGRDERHSGDAPAGGQPGTLKNTAAAHRRGTDDALCRTAALSPARGRGTGRNHRH
ncbi:hypothetical protein J4732_19490 [Serratia marcescens]|uniref:Uncharacterized protein n=1 Tax=Serratia marcescens TaxID=615 RepID=A0A939NLN2_SERMA|nr:hypothetical protein [Serratia marcescens]